MLPQSLSYLLVLFLVNPLSGQSLFDSENVRPGVNRPPKFLPGGDLLDLSLPEDTPVGTMVE